MSASVLGANAPLPKGRLSLQSGLLLAAVGLGILTGYLNLPLLIQLAEVVSDLFVRLLKLISMPICFLSITATLSGMKDLKALKSMGGQVLRYTLLTTLLASVVAWGFFVFFDPAVEAQSLLSQLSNPSELVDQALPISNPNKHVLGYFINAIPQHIFQPFIEGNIFGVMFLAIVISLATIQLEEEPKRILHGAFSSAFRLIMTMTKGLLKILPLAIWAFITLFVRDMQAMGSAANLVLQSLLWYLVCVIGANLVQALLVLPLFLRYHGLSPSKVFKAMSPAIFFAFWSKSSSATLPLAMECAEKRLKLAPAVSRFSLPLCTTVNMNACAAFIFLTVLFVAKSHGMSFSTADYLMWVIIATVSAIGNAGVPMGCYFLSSALVASLHLPLSLLAIILPFYSLIDMLETAINIWSDACVTAATNEAVQRKALVASLDPHV